MVPSVIVRILLRYGAGALVAAGWLLASDANALANDQEVIDLIIVAVGFAIAGVSEVWYWLARKAGWAT